MLVRQNHLACTSIGNCLAPRGRLDQRPWRALPDNAAMGLQKKIFSPYQSWVILSHQEHICTALGHSSPLFLQGGPMLLIGAWQRSTCMRAELAFFPQACHCIWNSLTEMSELASLLLNFLSTRIWDLIVRLGMLPFFPMAWTAWMPWELVPVSLFYCLCYCSSN